MSEEARRTFRYVEPLSDTRTPLADFFSILLETKTIDGIVESSNYPAALVIARARSGVNVLSDMLVAILFDVGWITRETEPIALQAQSETANPTEPQPS